MSELIETLTSYVPALITRRLAADPAPITAPVSERFQAAVLFADISGFTSLTERLVRRGPAGAETLPRLLNAYFGQLVDLVRFHGGDIVKFAGDALLAMWPVGATDEDLATVTYRAAQCGLLIQAVLHDHPVGEGVRLSLKISIGAGEILTKHVGGVYSRWEFVVAGAPLTQIGAAAHLSRPGQVILSPEAWALVADRCTGAPVRRAASNGAGEVAGMQLEDVSIPLPFHGEPPPALAVEAEKALRAYIPGAILARLTAGQGGWLAELRLVAVMFINLPDLDYAMPLAQAQIIMRALQTTLYHYEGSINKLNVDDKGVTLVAAMGLPPLAHEDDPARAVQAGLAMRAELGRLGLRAAVGVTTGRVFCGSVGSPVRREYTMLGDAVNMAARLMQAAPDDFLCDAATRQAARSQANLSFEKLPPVKVKGKAEPVAVYRPLAGSGPFQARISYVKRPRANVEMVGRAAERAILAEELQALLRRGSGSVIFIEGEAGIGKSRLVEDLLDRASALEITSLAGAGDAVEKSTPYYAWQSIFRQLLGLEGAGGDAASRRARALDRLQAALDPELLHLAPLLNAVLPLDFPENDLTAQMTGKVRADNTHELLVGLLQTTARAGPGLPEQPCLVVLEDAHWLDSASWALAWLANQRIQPFHPLLIVLAARPLPEPVPEEYSRFLSQPGMRRILLENLPVDDTLALVCQRLGVASLPEPLTALIRDKAEGHPFFSEELAYAVRDAGLLEIANGRCRLTVEASQLDAALNYPDTVQGVITSRIDRLTPPQQLTLKVASVMGRVFAFHTLRDIYPLEVDRPDLPTHLDALARLDITVLEKAEPELAYIFKHIITQEVAYNMMLYAQRQKLHRAAAEWYEDHYAGDLTSFYPLLAHHWRRAGVIDKALDYLEIAGQQALRNYASQEAVRFFSRALELAGPAAPQAGGDGGPAALSSRRRAGWELQLGQAYVHWRKLAEGRKHLEQGLKLLGLAVSETGPGLVRALLGQVGRQLLYRLFPGQRTADSERRATLLEAARAYEALVEVYYFANETGPTLHAAFRALNLAEAAGLSPELARGYTSVGALIGFVPVHPLANHYCRRALEIVRDMEDLPARIWVSLGAAIYYGGVGQWTQAGRLLDEIIALSERLGDRSRWDDGVSNLALVKYFQGDFKAGIELSDDLYRSAAQRNDGHNQAWALRGKIYCLLALGRFEAALECGQSLEHLLAADTDIVDEALKIDACGLLALIHLRLGRYEQAQERAGRAVALMERTSPTSYASLMGYAGVAEVYLALWRGRAMAGLKRPEPYALNSPTLAALDLDATPSGPARDRKAGLPSLEKEARLAVKAMHKYARIFSIGRPRVWLYQGLLHWFSRKPARARRAWKKGLALAERLGMPYEEGLAHYVMGRYLPAAEPARRRRLIQARTIFSQLEAQYDLARTEALIEKGGSNH